METYIVGHKNPDTDSIVSAIALADFKAKRGKNYKAARPGELNKETLYLLKRFNFGVPELIPEGEKRVMLVDHNEPSQINENVKVEEIVAIYDHHKLGGLSTPAPIKVKIKPLACVATIIAKMYKKNDIEPSSEIAGLLIGAVISDTLKFTSPTTTEKDKEMVEWLNQFAKVDIDELADGMFSAKSDISDIPTDELLGKDYKIFDMNGQKVGVGVWETVLPQTILERKEEIVKFLAEKKQKEGLRAIFFASVDILNNLSDFIILGEDEKEAGEKAFGGEVKDNILHLPGVVSRKKQMIPPLEGYFSQK